MNRRNFLLGSAAMGMSAATHAMGIDSGGHLLNPCARLRPELRAHDLTQMAFADLSAKDVWDCHVHMLGMGESAGGAWVSPSMQSLWHPKLYAQFRFYLNASCVDAGRKNVDGDFLARLVALMEDFPPGYRAMLMAFDRMHDNNGHADLSRSAFYVPNRYVNEIAAQHRERFAWTASVHPYRDDAVEALSQAAMGGAVAIKWLPSAMGIDPASPRCHAFYEAMVKHHLVLITHGGEEKAVEGAAQHGFGNVLKLRSPLELGVRVVVAHCSSAGRDVDLDRGENGAEIDCFTLFERLMADRSYQGRLFGDISALPQTNRFQVLPKILRHREWHDRLLNGSDYPLPGVFPLFSVDALAGKGWIPVATGEHLKRVREANPLLFDFLLKRHLRIDGASFGREVFETARVFRLPSSASA